MRYLFIILFILSCAQGKKNKSATAEATDSGQKKEVHFQEDFKTFIDYNGEKRPFLIYYAVDGANASDEPFMEAAVNHEIGLLESVCKENSRHVNWLIIRNSEVLTNGTYSYCWEGKLFKNVSLKHVLNRLHKDYIENLKPDRLSNDNCWMNGKKTELSKNLYFCAYEYTFPHPFQSFYAKIKDIREQLSKLEDSKVKISAVDEICYAPNPLLQLQEKCSEINENSTEELKLICHCKENKINGVNEFKQMCNDQNKHKESITNLCVGEINLFDIYKNKFPTIHPYFINALVNNQILHPFLVDQFLPIFHFKSHGHMDYALTGLLPHQLYIKALKQRKGLDSFKKLLVAAKRPEDLPPKEIFQNKLNNIIQKDPFLQTLKPSNKLNLLDQSDPCGLNESEKSFLSTNDAFSLGASSVYLGNQAGITPEVLYQSITKEQNRENKTSGEIPLPKQKFLDEKRLLFVFLEACDANINSDRWKIENNDIKHLLGAVFSAKGSLGYRNLDWDLIFNELGQISSQKQSQFLQRLMTELSKTIENKISINKDEEQGYLKTLEIIKNSQSKTESN